MLQLIRALQNCCRQRAAPCSARNNSRHPGLPGLCLAKCTAQVRPTRFVAVFSVSDTSIREHSSIHHFSTGKHPRVIFTLCLKCKRQVHVLPFFSEGRRLQHFFPCYTVRLIWELPRFSSFTTWQPCCIFPIRQADTAPNSKTCRIPAY